MIEYPMAIPTDMSYYKKNPTLAVKKVSSSSSSRRSKSKVSFADVQVRAYPIIPGHNPGGHDGPPLSLSFEYKNLGRTTVENFEANRRRVVRRPFRDLRITAERRVRLLRAAGYSDKEIVAATREAARDRKNRTESYRDTILKVRALMQAKAKLKARPAIPITPGTVKPAPKARQSVTNASDLKA
jgi:hypothetical protein